MDKTLFFIILLTIIFGYSKKIYNHKIVTIANSGILNKVCIFLIIFFITFENYIIGLLLMLIYFDILTNDNYNENFGCKFINEDDREP